MSRRLIRESLGAFFCTAFMGPGSAAVIHVDATATGAANGTTWTDAFVSVQDALSQAQAGDQIWVAEGTYTPSVADVTVSFVLKDGVQLYGGFLGFESSVEQRAGSFEKTVLSGDLGQEHSLTVVTATGLSSATVIDGFAIREGRSTDAAGGMRLTSSDLVVRNVFFSNNLSWSKTVVRGGAVTIEGGSPSFSRCFFEGNGAIGDKGTSIGDAGTGYGGAVYQKAANTVFDRCWFLFNWAEGGDFVKAIGNPGPGYGGAVAVLLGQAVFRNCVFAGNVARGGVDSGIGVTAEAAGGAVLAIGSAEFENCRLNGNKAVVQPVVPFVDEIGGGVFVRGDARFSNCTLYQNLGKVTGGIHLDSGTARFENSIAWNNGLSEAAQLGSGPAAQWTVQYSIVKYWSGAFGGEGNSGEAPQFVDPSGADDVAGNADDDLSLKPGSPGVDAGNNALAPKDALDLDGDGDVTEPVPFDLFGAPRFSDDPTKTDTGAGIVPVVDMGALERQGDFCQWNMGFQGPGDLQISLCGEPLTAAGNTATFSLQGAPPSSPVLLFASTIAQPTPAAGGILVPVPPLLVLSLASDPGGALTFHPAGANGPPVTVYLQAVSPVAPVEISNALEIVTGT